MMRRASSTSNFSREANIRLAAGALVGILLFSLGVRVLDYLYFEPDERSRITLKSFYMQEDIDTIFLGSSHVYHDIDVFFADELYAGNCFELSTGNQHLQESYYALLESDRKYNVETVFLELYYYESTAREGNYTDVETVKNSWRFTDYMNPGLTRTQAIWDMSGPKHIFEAYFPFLRFRKYLFDWEHIQNQYQLKSSDNYKNYSYYRGNPEVSHEELSIEKKGFVYSDVVFSNPYVKQICYPDELIMSKDSEKYLRKIISYTKKKNMDLTLFISPMYALPLIADTPYDIYLDSVKNIARDYGLEVYDFNLVDKEYFDISIEECRDDNHLNIFGAEKFTDFMFEVLESDDPSKYFYSSYAEKLKKEEPTLYGGCWLKTGDNTESEENTETIEDRQLMLAASDNPNLEFEVSLAQDVIVNAENPKKNIRKYTQLQPFDTNRYFAIPADEHGTVVVRWRLKDSPDDVKTLEFSY